MPLQFFFLPCLHALILEEDAQLSSQDNPAQSSRVFLVRAPSETPPFSECHSPLSRGDRHPLCPSLTPVMLLQLHRVNALFQTAVGSM